MTASAPDPIARRAAADVRHGAAVLSRTRGSTTATSDHFLYEQRCPSCGHPASYPPVPTNALKPVFDAAEDVAGYSFVDGPLRERLPCHVASLVRGPGMGTSPKPSLAYNTIR